MKKAEPLSPAGHAELDAKVLAIGRQLNVPLPWQPSDAQRGWLANALQNGRQVVIEPWLQREVDFSVQLEMGPRRLRLCGYRRRRK